MIAACPKLEAAIAYAIAAHAGQSRKASDVPAVTHPISVAILLAGYGARPEEIIAAILHDVIEDASNEIQVRTRMLEELGTRFGDDVRALVATLTEPPRRPDTSWRARKQAYLSQLECGRPEAVRIAGVDKLHNLQGLNHRLRAPPEGDFWHHFRGGPDGILWYTGRVLELLKVHAFFNVARDLQEAMADFEQLARAHRDAR